MSRTEHALERRSRKLGVALKKRVETLRDSIAAPGERKPWTEAMTRREALAFWRANRYNPAYAQVLAAMKPDDVLALDVELAKMNEIEAMGVGDGLG